MKSSDTLLQLESASIQFGDHAVWSNLNISVQSGEFLAVLGPNGTGKTTLLKAILGLQQLSSGSIVINGKKPHRGNKLIGYVPQQKSFDDSLPIRGIDLVHFGLDGTNFGFSRHDKASWLRVNEVIKEVGADTYADKPIGLLSGGQQQRLRIAQSLLSKPEILLCDEPLLSLDIKSQEQMSELINSYRKLYNSAVIFVTHDINPIINIVDRVLYFAESKWAIGSPGDILTSKKLSQLYGTDIDVVRVKDRIIVVNDHESSHHGMMRSS